MHDQMTDGQAFRILTVIDQWSRESVCLEATSCGQAGALDRRWIELLSSADGLKQSPWTTAQSSLPKPSMNGPTDHHRPHGSLGHLTSSEFVRKRSVQPNEAIDLQL